MCSASRRTLLCSWRRITVSRHKNSFISFSFYLKSLITYNHAFILILYFCFWFCFPDTVVKNNDNESVKMSPCREKKGDEDELCMVMKNNECEPGKCVSPSTCLKKRNEEDELSVHTIFGERTSIYIYFRLHIYVKVPYYLRHISILFFKDIIICRVFKFNSSLLCNFV